MVERNKEYATPSNNTTRGEENQPYDGKETSSVRHPIDMRDNSNYWENFYRDQENFEEAASNAEALQEILGDEVTSTDELVPEGVDLTDGVYDDFGLGSH